MPIHKIGGKAKPIAPFTKDENSTPVTDKVVESWFKNAFLPLQDDPYIFINMEHENFSTSLYAISDDGKSMGDCSHQVKPIKDFTLEEQKFMFNKSREGKLFYFDPSLGEEGGMRQLYTKTTKVGGKDDFELCVTDKVEELPKKVPEEPKAPSWWTYIKSLFSQAAKDLIKLYKEMQADFVKGVQAATTFANRTDLATLKASHYADGALGTTFQNAKQIREERVKKYETEKKNARDAKVEESNKKKLEAMAKQDRKTTLSYQTDPITPGLKLYNKEGMRTCFGNRIAVDKNSVPANSLGYGGMKVGTLVTMALASPNLSIKIDRSGNREYNDPEVNYDKIVGGHYIAGNAISPTSRSAGYIRGAKAEVNEALKAADQGDYSKLGKIIANGLIQNNRVLKAHRELTDTFSAYAQLGSNVLEMMKENPDLDSAVKEQLGPDAEKHINIAKAAQNVSKMRKEAAEIYGNMLDQYGRTFTKVIKDKEGNVIGEDVFNEISGKNTDIAKVIQLYNVELQMNTGKFDLENTEYLIDGTAESFVNKMVGNAVLRDFLSSGDRVETLKNPIAMKSLCEKAVNWQKKQVAKQSTAPVATNEMQVEQPQLTEPKVAP